MLSEAELNGEDNNPSSNNISNNNNSKMAASNSSSSSSSTSTTKVLVRRGKYDREGSVEVKRVRATVDHVSREMTKVCLKKTKKKSKLSKKHERDSPSGGMEALIPSLLGVLALVIIILGKMGFRGRATVAGIDLGTTNSVICVQQQSKGVGEIECIPDPFHPNNSPIIPSVISILDSTPVSSNAQTKRNIKDSRETSFPVDPSFVVVGSQAKRRIDSHPHHTLYHAKRVIAQSFDSPTVKEMMEEVEFDILPNHSHNHNHDTNNNNNHNGVLFRVPFHHHHHHMIDNSDNPSSTLAFSPQQVGSYVVNHLIQLTQNYLGHENVKSAVIAVPAKFDRTQRDITVEAFKMAGITVTRILEEPVAAALAYGLQKKQNVDYIMVYDFGGGTLDVSVLHVAEGGYVEVMGSDGDEHLGGADFDAAVAHLLLDKYDKNKDHTTATGTGTGTGISSSSSTSHNGILQTLTNAIANIVEKQQQQQQQQPKEDDANDDANYEYDVEEHLASACPKLKQSPLCTISSFHTIAEKIKIQLSAYPDGGATVQETCFGLTTTTITTTATTSSDYDSNVTFEFDSMEELCSQLEVITLEVTSSEYDTVCNTLYDRSMIPIRRLLEDLNLEKEEVDEVVMVGGTTRMPKIRTMVQEELGVSSLNTEIDPDITVAYGAASVID